MNLRKFLIKKPRNIEEFIKIANLECSNREVTIKIMGSICVDQTTAIWPCGRITLIASRPSKPLKLIAYQEDDSHFGSETKESPGLNNEGKLYFYFLKRKAKDYRNKLEENNFKVDFEEDNQVEERLKAAEVYF